MSSATKPTSAYAAHLRSRWAMTEWCRCTISGVSSPARHANPRSPVWIVRIALNRPYTFIVLAILILFVGPLTILRTPTDIFPNINIPFVTVVWTYGGFYAEEMASRIVTPFERTMTTTVNDVEHIESNSLRGV